MAKEFAVVDGSNIAFAERSKDGKPKVSNIVAVRRMLSEQGYSPIIIVDAALRHQVDNPEQLESMIKDQVVRQAPAETDADFFVLKTAEEENAPVISNDLYEPYREQFPWIAERRVPFMIVAGNVELYQEPLDATS